MVGIMLLWTRTAHMLITFFENYLTKVSQQTWILKHKLYELRLIGWQRRTLSWILFVGNVCLWIRSAYYLCGTELDGRSWPTGIAIYCPAHTRDFLTLGRKRGDLTILWTRGLPERVCPHIRLQPTEEYSQ
ncbi:hypothetical protein HYC85_026574 [Camellia sinensis]|uniref:Uncharacterized protein n=1 Tax=Camellia sinensis TaxID=4442 RepID=A0A7J7G570_CAMSI|nr:hypothetical protein HYC85_026574 [Camellia sinensis]